MGQRRYVLWVDVFWMVVIWAMVAYSQTMDFGDATTLVQEASGTVFGYLKSIASVGLFGYALYLYIDGYIKKQLHQNWIYIAGIAIFLVVLNSINWIYRAITGAGMVYKN